MDQYAMVEKLRKKANVSYNDAYAALESCNWDILDALTLLETQQKANGQPENEAVEAQPSKDSCWKIYVDNDIKKAVKRIWNFLCMVLRKGNANTFIITNKKREEVIALPVTALVLLIIGFWPWTVLLLIAALFFGARYAFKGPDLGQKVNDAMDRAADIAQGTEEK